MIRTSLLLLLVVAADDKPAPKFPVGRETTYVTGPLDKDGYIDYQAALNDRLGKGITPDQNANVLLWKALGPTPGGSNRMPAEYFKRLGIDEPPKSGDYFIDLRTLLKDHARIESGRFNSIFDQEDRAWRRPWAAKDYPYIAAWLMANEKPLAVAVEATKRPDYFNPIVWQKSEKDSGSLIRFPRSSVQQFREIALSLAARAMLRVGEGKVDDAWQDLLACHRLGRLVSRGATIPEALVGNSVDYQAIIAELAYLERAKLSAQQIRDRLKELQGLPPLAPLADKIDLDERFFFLDTLQNVRRDGFGFLEGLFGVRAGKPSAEELKVAGKTDWAPVLSKGSRWYDRLAAVARIKDRAAREKEFGMIDTELKAQKHNILQSPGLKTKTLALVMGASFPDKALTRAIGDELITQIMTSFRKVQWVYDRSEQVNRNLHVAFALAAYQRDNGRYPAKLDELAPKYLAAVPDDLFAGKPLVYRPTENGYLLYSVGINGKDEGGRSHDNDYLDADDLSVKMPLPKLEPSVDCPCGDP
jgi:hypothetical protein